MPRITDARREARRQSYLTAAWRCFDRRGVAATTMEHVTAEAGVSAGSLYLYFPSKDDLIRAAMEASLDRLAEVLRGLPAELAGSPREYLRAAVEAVERFQTTPDGVDLFTLALQGWAHAKVDAATASLIRAKYTTIRDDWCTQLESAGATADEAADQAAAMGVVLLGFIAERSLLGGPSAATLDRGLSTLR